MTTGFQYICYKRPSEAKREDAKHPEQGWPLNKIQTALPRREEPSGEPRDPYSFFYEAAESIMSLRRFSDLPITIKTDEPDFFNQVPVDNLTTIKIDQKFDRPFFRTHEKLYQLKDLPYDNTFLVDTETIFLDNPETLLSSHQHIQMARETRPVDMGDLALYLLKIFNTGFIVVECNKQWKKIIDKSVDIFENIDNYPLIKVNDGLLWQGDQWFFNKAIDLIYDTRLGVLPQEWNVRQAMLDIIEKPKLIHVRGKKFLEKQKQKHNFPLHYLGMSPIEGRKFFKEGLNFSKQMRKKS